ncbi:MAG: alpha/beta hydrolase [Blastocatellia bacterium]
MLISKNKRVLLKRIFWVFVPAVLVFVVGVAALGLYMVNRLSHPARTVLYGSPRDFQLILQRPMWYDEKWKQSDGTPAVGWLLLRDRPAPAIILSHSYGSNRSQLLTLSFELWKAGYHVLLYDLRGHGESQVKWSGLGTYERDDLLSAIKFLKERKNEKGELMLDGRVGLYGVDLGGYASLAASAEDPIIKAVAVDSVFPDVNHFVNAQLKSGVGNNEMGNRLVDSRWTKRLAELSMQVYLLRREEGQPALEAVATATGRNLLFITASDTGVYDLMTRELYNAARGQKELVEVPHSRMTRLYEKEASDYDARVTAFFQQAMPVATDKKK